MVFKIKISGRCTQYSQRTKPAVSSKQERTVDWRISDVLAKIYYAEEDTQKYCCGRKDEPYLFQLLDDFFMRENEISQEEHDAIQSETVYDNNRCIADLSKKPDHKNSQKQYGKIYLSPY